MKRYTKKMYTTNLYTNKLAEDSEKPGLAESRMARRFEGCVTGIPQGAPAGSWLCTVSGAARPESRGQQTDAHYWSWVFELREQDERAWYRVIYLKKVKNVVYVLHCFEKQTGKTEQQDINTARERLKRLQERQRQDERIAKQKKHTADEPDARKRP